MAPIKIKFARDFEMMEERMRRLMENMFGPWSGPATAAAPKFQPAADIYETPQALVIRMEVAGLSTADISLTLHRQELVVEGRRRFPANDPVRRFHRLEIDYGSFARRFPLPKTIDDSQVEAEYQNGILTIRLRWREASPPRHIAIREEE
ncbi:MAG: Hsp20/alpha crystallin family protein [Desulfobacca sp.]|uniref:Hsp20/alpha crystallin family protein n=1 Tax=Desulfobacca sp. TaxID=2067990 RepID=UPI00404AD416